MDADELWGRVTGGRIWCIGVHIACITSGGRLSKRIMVNLKTLSRLSVVYDWKGISTKDVQRLSDHDCGVFLY